MVWPDKMTLLSLGADMRRPSKTGGTASETKARNASLVKARKTAKSKPRVAPAAARVERRSISDPSKELKETMSSRRLQLKY